MRTLVLVDGEHHPPVVRAAIARLHLRVPGASPVAAVLVGGTEKLPAPDRLESVYGLPVVTGADPEDALQRGIDVHHPRLVVDLADEPVLDGAARLRLVALVLAAGAGYRCADATFEPPPRPRLTAKPSVAVIGTGKRSGKTAVTAHLARLLRRQGCRPVVVTMGRGGPPGPELIEPGEADLTPRGLVALAAAGRHAASDHFEDALVAGVPTIGTARCGGGLAGAPFDDGFAAGVALADTRPEPLVLLEGSGRVVPPCHADATICAVPASLLDDVDRLAGHLGGYPLLLADLVVVTMTPSSAREAVERSVRGLAPRAKVVTTTFRPHPLESISGRRIVYATTAPASVAAKLAQHLEREYGCEVVGTTSHLADRQQLAVDLEATASFDLLLVELKAAAVDLATRVALERGRDVVYCENRVVPVGGSDVDGALLATAELAIQRSETA